MMTVYTVWYIPMDAKNEISRLWGICTDEGRAQIEIEKILSDNYGTKAWYNDEEVMA